MARYILIDHGSGYIWGDTADCANQSDLASTPIDAARWLDESLGEHGREYTEVMRLDGRSGYDVYRADANGSDVVGSVSDGQDRDTIMAVIRDCEWVATVAYSTAAAT